MPNYVLDLMLTTERLMPDYTPPARDWLRVFADWCQKPDRKAGQFSKGSSLTVGLLRLIARRFTNSIRPSIVSRTPVWYLTKVIKWK